MKLEPLLDGRRNRIEGDPLWYKDAIIYELRVRSYMDSNGDGIGDFPGLTSRLDYLSDLGVTTLWLLPICASPNRDDGYDISDYTDVHPELGTIDDFRTFLDEAHRRGLRVVTELVLNHTSDQHPWFQRARRAPAGSPERDFYVWSDSPDRYQGARIIFKDFEPSNWSWDPVAKAYFWHRFYAHQPDLNYQNPAVHEAMLRVVDFWFDLGVDGLRLDAVPYLYEAEDTSCENLPATHEFLRALRRHVDARHKNRMLLAEANQWPEDAAAYFGAGDECHMNFHFPVMPRIFMSIHMEDRLPIVDIQAQTPAIPENCQWALFLRNHDELTLEMVTDEERDYMYRAFARDSTMRINLGIRRRLAPLLGNDRRNIELMNGLLLSLPGTPVIYYGDEIAMGDNVYLGDRNGVRTPMQWSADRNAGFSRANPQRLVLPVIIDPEYHFESINVEAQQSNSNSLLWWMKRIIALRKRFKAFGRGSIEFLVPDNPRVLAFVRRAGAEIILVVANLSRHVQFVELNLARYQGMRPVELFGRTRFPLIGELPYLLTLGGHEFYWFVLEEPHRADEEVREASYPAPTIEVAGAWDRVLAAETMEHEALEVLLPGWVIGRRWFAGRDRDLVATRLVEVVPLGVPEGGLALYLAQLQVDFALGEPEHYALPLALAEGKQAEEMRERTPQAVIAHLRPQGWPPAAAEPGPPRAALFDALAEPASAAALFDVLRAGARVRTREGAIAFSTVDERASSLPPAETLQVLPVRGDHKHAAVNYGDRYVLKFFRPLGEGITPELEIARFLAHRPADVAEAFPMPGAPLVGALEYRVRRGEPITLATLLDYVPAEGSAHGFFQRALRRFYERTLAGAQPPPGGAHGGAHGLLRWALEERPHAAGEALGNDLPAAYLLGRRTADMHLALASGIDDPAFAPDVYSPLDQRSFYQSLRNLTGRVLRELRLRNSHLPEPAGARARLLLDNYGVLYKRFEPLLEHRLTARKTRVHGHYHLGTVIYTGKDFVVLDFDGDPSRPLPERRRKRSPLQDVASMVRSLQLVAYTALDDEAMVREADRAAAAPWAREWATRVPAAFVRSWLDASGGASYVPIDRAELVLLLDTLLIEQSLYEVLRELDGSRRHAEIALEALVEDLGLA